MSITKLKYALFFTHFVLASFKKDLCDRLAFLYVNINKTNIVFNLKIVAHIPVTCLAHHGMRCVDKERRISLWRRFQAQLTITSNRVVHEHYAASQSSIVQYLLKKTIKILGFLTARNDKTVECSSSVSLLVVFILKCLCKTSFVSNKIKSSVLGILNFAITYFLLNQSIKYK